MLKVGLSDHQQIYCTRKNNRIKVGGPKQIKLPSFKNYAIDGYEKNSGWNFFFFDYKKKLIMLMMLIQTSFKNSKSLTK